MNQTKSILEALSQQNGLPNNFKYYNPESDYWDFLENIQKSNGEVINPIFAKVRNSQYKYNVYILIYGYNYKDEHSAFLEIYLDPGYEMVSKDFNPDNIDQLFEYGINIFNYIKKHNRSKFHLLLEIKNSFPELGFTEVTDGMYVVDDLTLPEGEIYD